MSGSSSASESQERSGLSIGLVAVCLQCSPANLLGEISSPLRANTTCFGFSSFIQSTANECDEELKTMAGSKYKGGALRRSE